MLVAVTGASGHVGANLVRALIDRGDAVRAIVGQDRRAMEGLDVDLRSLDIADAAAVREALEGVEVVFHLAAVISIVGERDWPLLERINVGGVHNVVQACADLGVRRLVHFSSIHALRGDVPGAMVTEDSGLAETDGDPAYDRSKARGEREVLRGVDKGLDAVIVNPTSVVGPNDFKPSHQSKAIMTLVARRYLPVVSAGYDWVDVRDVAAGALLALEKGRTGERYLLANQYLSFRDIARIIERTTGLGVPPVSVPLWTGYAGVPFARLWSAVSGQKQLLTQESIRILQRHQSVSHDKADSELGYAPRSFEETLRDSFAWYRDAGLLPPRLARRLTLPS